MLTQIEPLPVTTPRGPGYAHFVIDYGMEHNLQWVVFLNSDGQCWTFCNPEIRLSPNHTLGRLPVKPPFPPGAQPGQVYTAPNIPHFEPRTR